MRMADTRWCVEECFQAAKGFCPLVGQSAHTDRLGHRTSSSQNGRHPRPTAAITKPANLCGQSTSYLCWGTCASRRPPPSVPRVANWLEGPLEPSHSACLRRGSLHRGHRRPAPPMSAWRLPDKAACPTSTARRQGLCPPPEEGVAPVAAGHRGRRRHPAVPGLRSRAGGPLAGAGSDAAAGHGLGLPASVAGPPAARSAPTARHRRRTRTGDRRVRTEGVQGLSGGPCRRRGGWYAHLRRCLRLSTLRVDALLRLAAARTSPRSPASIRRRVPRAT
jgi:hypothetical protein